MSSETGSQNSGEPGFLGGLVNKVTGMFRKDDGSLNWLAIVGLAGGAAAGLFLAPATGVMAVLAPVLGAVGGLFVGKAIGGHHGAAAVEEAGHHHAHGTHAMGNDPRVEMPQGMPPPPKQQIGR